MATNIKNIYGIEMNDCKISGDIIVTDGIRPILSNSPKIGKKEEIANEAVEAYMNMENISGPLGSFKKGFLAGWDACMKNLAELPWDEAINEIVNNCKEKEY